MGTSTALWPVFALALLICSGESVQAAVSEDILTETTWTPAGSPLVIQTDIN